MRRLIRKQCFYWDAFVNRCLDTLQILYSFEKHGLNLSKSGFIKSEVLRADECIFQEKENDLMGFAFIMTNKHSVIYVTLMASFEKKFGTLIMRFLEESIIFSHSYIVLRATCNSVQFYTKLGYRIFDFLSLTNYVHGSCNDDITEAIKVSTVANLPNICKLIVQKNLMPTGSNEFPLLKYRSSVSCASSKSSRLQAKKFVVRTDR